MVLGIYGAGALGREILEIAEDINNTSDRWEDFVYLVDNSRERRKDGLEIYSPEAFAKLEEHKEVVIAIGEPFAREKMMKKILGLGISLAYPLIHPSAKVNSACQIGVGTVIGYSTIISFDAQIDNNVYIQPGCGVGHEASIGRNCVISAGVRIAGCVSIGKNTYIGLSVPVRDRKSNVCIFSYTDRKSVV